MVDECHILVVEDDPRLRERLARYLAGEGFRVTASGDAADARAKLRAINPDLLVLDVMMPGESGLELTESLRRSQAQPVPILLLTARAAPEDRIAGFEAGADDYLAKPFDLDELAARLRAIVRREGGRAAPTLTHGAVVLSPSDLSVTVAGKSISLSRREFAILSALMERPEQVRSRAELEERLYGWQDDIESNAVEVHIHNLRAKIGRDAIQTLRGVGYRMGSAR
jgi:two-component system, OmpR family, response regulator QseB